MFLNNNNNNNNNNNLLLGSSFTKSDFQKGPRTAKHIFSTNYLHCRCPTSDTWDLL